MENEARYEVTAMCESPQSRGMSLNEYQQCALETAVYPEENLHTMTDKDRKLVEEAESLYRAIDWEYANRLLEHAESAEARRRIERVVKSLYHKEHD